MASCNANQEQIPCCCVFDHLAVRSRDKMLRQTPSTVPGRYMPVSAKKCVILQNYTVYMVYRLYEISTCTEYIVFVRFVIHHRPLQKQTGSTSVGSWLMRVQGVLTFQ